jgi:catechol 2,3-dioxygenase-like lactoylglutathione lyase family enzyme
LDVTWVVTHKLLMSNAPLIDRFAHLTFPVDDLEQAESFYVGTLGARLVRKVDRDAFLRLRPERAHEVDADNSPLHLAVTFHDTPELHLFLQRNRPKRAPQPHPHLALNVDSDELDVFIARLVASGIRLDGPRRLGPPGHASVYFADPFGNLLELVTMGYRGCVNEGPPDVSQLGR